MVAFVLAITAAFAFTPATDSGVTLHFGAKKVGATCVQTSTQCTDVPSAMICKDISNNALYRYIGPTSCPDQLWKVIN